MRNAALALIALIFVLTSSPAWAGEIPASIVDGYLKIHAALAGDKTDGVQAAAKALAADARALGAAGEKTQAAAGKLATATDIKTARAAFGDLSDAVIALVGGDSKDVKKAYCPVVKKYWLQKGEQIENPYYGSQMLRCGSFQK